MFFNFEKYYGLYKAFDFSVTRIKMTSKGKCKCYVLNKDNASVSLSLGRSHHVLAEYLKKFFSKNSQWDDWIKLATFSYNTSFHEGTRCTPYEVVYGKLARQPLSEALPEHGKIEAYGDYSIKLVTRRHAIREIARNNRIAAKEKPKTYDDKNISPQNFNVDECVFLLSGPKPKNLENEYSSPYKILEI